MSASACRQLPASNPATVADPGALLKLEEDLAALIAEGMLRIEIDLEGTQRFSPVAQ